MIPNILVLLLVFLSTLFALFFIHRIGPRFFLQETGGVNKEYLDRRTTLDIPIAYSLRTYVFEPNPR